MSGYNDCAQSIATLADRARRRRVLRTALTTLLRAMIYFTVLIASFSIAHAAEWANDFESPERSWSVFHSNDRSKSTAHERVSDFSHTGDGSESFQFQSTGETTFIWLEHTLPAAAAIEELSASVWVNSTRNGAFLALRVVFPHQTNPNNSKPAFVYVRGTRYESAGRWQKIECQAEKLKLQRQIQRMRSEFPADNLRDAYVDAMLLVIPMQAGTANLAVDDAAFGPIVPPRSTVKVAGRDDDADNIRRRVSLRLGQLQIDGEPFFPIMVPSHGEDPREFKSLGVNVVWVPEFQDQALLEQLRAHDLWATAVPPQAKSAGGDWLTSHNASLVPFSQNTEAVAFWMLGSKITPESNASLLNWTEQVRSADRAYDRPLMADVQGTERISSRHLSLLGSSRPVMQTTFSLRAYRDWLKESRNLAVPGSFVWTWIATESYPALASSRNSPAGQPAYIEPEQLRLQLYAALAAGCRGIGYWSTSELNDTDRLDMERRLAITQLNHELQILGPMLAMSTLVTQIPFSINDNPPPQLADAKVLSFQGRKSYDPNAPKPQEKERLTDRRQPTSPRRTAEAPDDVIYEAALLSSPLGRLILPICYQENAQFVPGSLTARGVRILVSDVEETASAWEITPTRIRLIQKERVAGGVELKLPTLDMTTAIVLTSDLQVIESLRARIRAISAEHARVSVALARAKFERTAKVDAELTSLGAALPDAFNWINEAGKHLRHSEAALDRQEFSTACHDAANAMQYVRILQRSHWEAAIRRWSSPASSPHTLSFQTLPDHWRMLSRISKAAEVPTENRLPSGSFEDFDAMIASGWRHEQATVAAVASRAQLGSPAHQGEFSLRLASLIRPGHEKPVVLREQRIAVHSPPVVVRPGELLQVSGWVRIRTPVDANLDGVMVYDNLLGPPGGLRWPPKGDFEKSDAPESADSEFEDGARLASHTESGSPHPRRDGEWQRFEFLREVATDHEYVLTFSLGGLGDVSFDDVRVHIHDLRDIPLAPGEPMPSNPAETEEGDPFSPFNIDLFKKLNVLPAPGDLPKLPLP